MTADIERKLLEEMAGKITYHGGVIVGPGDICAVDENTQYWSRGNVVGFLPLWVNLGKLTESEALNVLSQFNLLTGDHVEMVDGRLIYPPVTTPRVD